MFDMASATLRDLQVRVWNPVITISPPFCLPVSPEFYRDVKLLSSCEHSMETAQDQLDTGWINAG